MQPRTDIQLLSDYSQLQDEGAFCELVNRYANLVFSAALRQVDSPAVASDLAQQVFTDLANKADHLAREVNPLPSLAGWLHRATRYAVLNHLRTFRRRRENERLAMEQLLTNSTPDANWEEVRPQLDTALDELEPEDREILLLRYFQNQDFRSVGAALGISDDAAQKRASRAVDQLRERLAKQGITASATGLALVISVHAVHAAPGGLAAQISTAALAAKAATTAVTTATLSQTIAMTTLQKVIIATTIAALAGVGLYENRQAARLRAQNQTLQQQQAATASQLERLQHERDDATNRVSQLAGELAAAQKRPEEVLKLRGQVGQMHQQFKNANDSSALDKFASNPADRQQLRQLQKQALGAIYADLARKLSLPKDQADKLNNLLADNVMDNIDRITRALHENKSAAEIDQIFTESEANQAKQIGAEFGDAVQQEYTEYNRNLLSILTAAQFAMSGNLTGTKTEVATKTKELRENLQTAAAATLQNAGLSADYQLVPSLNFRNIASETTAEQNLALLNTVYQQAITSSQTFLSSEEQANLQSFLTNAISMNRWALAANRKMMSPLLQ